MSEQDNQTGAKSPADSQTPAPEGAGTGEQESGSQKGNKEARYRVERNEARAERDALAERIQRMHRAEVERLASDALSHPADLFSLSGNELADYLTEDGDVDAEKVAADVVAILAERPGLRKTTPGYDPSQGFGGTTPKNSSPSWEALLSN